MKDVGLRPRPRDSNWSKRTKNRSHCVRFATSFQRVERFGLPASSILRLPFTSTLRKSSISGCRKRRDKISYPNNFVVEFFCDQFRYAWHATRRTFISSLFTFHVYLVYYVYYETCIKLSIRFRTGFPFDYLPAWFFGCWYGFLVTWIFFNLKICMYFTCKCFSGYRFLMNRTISLSLLFSKSRLYVGSINFSSCHVCSLLY